MTIGTLRIGSTAPDFTAESTAGPLRLSDYARNSWLVFFSHPRSRTPVCTTEFGAVARLAGELARRGVKALGLSTDAVERHREWVGEIERTQGGEVAFPIVADGEGRVAQMYGMLDAEGEQALSQPSPHLATTVRSVSTWMLLGVVCYHVVYYHSTVSTPSHSLTYYRVAVHYRSAAQDPAHAHVSGQLRPQL